jgi:competence protein ComEC
MWRGKTAHQLIILWCACFLLCSIVFTVYGDSTAVWFFGACAFAPCIIPSLWRQACVCGTAAMLALVLVWWHTPEVLLIEKNITLSGVVDAEPDVRIGETRYSVRTDMGRWQVRAPQYPAFSYGNRVSVECRVIPARGEGERFDWQRYLYAQGFRGACSASTLFVEHRGEGAVVFRVLLRIKERVAETVAHMWPEPYASFAAGVLYGYRGGLGDLGDLFQRTGVTHIVAVSGYNVTVLVGAILALMSTCLIPKRKALLCAAIGVACFVLFTGASASVMRAGSMGLIVIFARSGGRVTAPWKLLVYAAVCMALFNPYSIMYDAGFQLSFLATCGLIYISPMLEKYMRFVPDYFGLREACISTLAAFFAVLPLSLYLFETFSLYTIVVNMLVVPVVPWIMASSGIAVAAGFLHSTLGIGIGTVAYGLMRYVVFVVDTFAYMPHAVFTIPWFGGFLVLFYYVCLLWLIWRRSCLSTVPMV